MTERSGEKGGLREAAKEAKEQIRIAEPAPSPARRTERVAEIRAPRLAEPRQAEPHLVPAPVAAAPTVPGTPVPAVVAAPVVAAPSVRQEPVSAEPPLVTVPDRPRPPQAQIEEPPAAAELTARS